MPALENKTMHTTQEVCTIVGCTPAALNSWLSRNPKYKPVQRTKDGWLWSDDEIDRLREARRVSTAKNRHKGRL